jgi:hypothetical protein
MSASSALFLLVLLACPLMMVFMMRGGHGHGGHGGHDQPSQPVSTDDLHRRRDELDREIAARDGR